VWVTNCPRPLPLGVCSQVFCFVVSLRKDTQIYTRLTLPFESPSRHAKDEENGLVQGCVV